MTNKTNPVVAALGKGGTCKIIITMLIVNLLGAVTDRCMFVANGNPYSKRRESS